jgi:hypothetical protein
MRTRHDRATLQHALDDAQRVVQGAVHLVEVHVVGASQQQRGGARRLGAADLDL